MADAEAGPATSKKGKGKGKKAAAPTNDATADGEYELWDNLTHMREKTMWGGALRLISDHDMLGLGPDGRVFSISQPHAPIVAKIIDEIMVNAIDHAVGTRHLAGGERVTKIKITFDRTTGRVSVGNTGRGILVKVHEKATRMHGGALNRQLYAPEVLFSIPLSGSNMVAKAGSVKGGTNGIGCKLATVSSSELTLVTADAATKFTQHYRNRLRRPEDTDPPTIEAHKGPQFTKVSFTPAYAEFGYTMLPGGALDQDASASLDAWLRLRVMSAAAYLHSMCGEGAVQVTYNDVPCVCEGAVGLARLLATQYDPDVAAQVTVLGAAWPGDAAPYDAIPWDVAIFVCPPGAPKRRNKQLVVDNYAMINGVVTPAGTHVKYVRGVLSDEAAVRLKALRRSESGPKMTETMADIRVIICGALPGAEWTGQRKDKLGVPEALVRHYKPQDKVLRDLGLVIAERVLMNESKSKHKRKLPSKYQPPHLLGRAAAWPKLGLIVSEGDSANAFVRGGLGIASARARGVTKGKKPAVTKGKKQAAAAPAEEAAPIPPGHGDVDVSQLEPSFEYYGTMTLGGVIMNAMREVKYIKTSAGMPVRVLSDRLRNNAVLNGVADIIGLEYDKHYPTAADRRRLAVSHVITAVDADVDGAGKILPLFLTWIFVFWPELLEAGFVKRLITPVMRAYATKRAAAMDLEPVAEFRTEADAENWIKADPARAKLVWMYYKGLDAHGKVHARRRMFAKDAFRRSIYTFTLEDGDKALFDIYFGADAAARRKVMSEPPPTLSPLAVARRDVQHLITCGDQMRTDAHAFKLAAVERQIPDVMDTLAPARRKVVAAALKRWARNVHEMIKVFMLGGYVSVEFVYKHGPQSLASTIFAMMTEWPGSNTVRLLNSIGGTGDRMWWGSNHGADRYVTVGGTPVAAALFRRADEALLPLTMDEGVVAEPRYYVPVMPPLHETRHLPSEGWVHRSFARDPTALVQAVLATMTDNELGARLRVAAAATRAGERLPDSDIRELAAAVPLPLDVRGFRGRVGRRRGCLVHYGAYTYDAETNTILVTDMPVGEPTVALTRRILPPSFETAADMAKATKGGGPVKHQHAAKIMNPALARRLELIEEAHVLSDEVVYVQIKLRPGAMDKIREMCGTKPTDSGVLDDVFGSEADVPPGHADAGVLPGHADAADMEAAQVEADELNARIAASEAADEELDASDAAPDTPDDALDPVIEFLHLWCGLKPHLNYYSPDGRVITFRDYIEHFLFWFEERAKLYVKRVARDVALFRARVCMEENTLRYIGMATELALKTIDDEKAATTLLLGHHFAAFNAGLIARPGRATVEEIEAACQTDGVNNACTFDYIFDLPERALLKSAAVKRQGKLAALQASLRRAEAQIAERPVPCASLWRAELRHFLEVAHLPGAELITEGPAADTEATDE